MKLHNISDNVKYYLMFFIYSLISIFFIEFSFYFYDLQLTMNWIFHNIYLYLISVLITMMFMVFLFALLRNLAFAIFIPTFVSIGYGIGIYTKLLYRETPILPYEISLIFDLKELLSFLNQAQRIAIYIILVCAIIALVLLLKFVKRKELSLGFRLTNLVISSYVILMLITYNTRNAKLFLLVNILFLVLVIIALVKSNLDVKYKAFASVLCFVIIVPSYNENTVKKLISYKAVYPEGDLVLKNFNLDGVIPAFLSYSHFEYVTKPENYSEEEISRIVNKYKEIEKTQNATKVDINSVKPNIVYIMSESFSDPKNVNQISVNKNPLQNFDELKNIYPSGETVAQGYGGGTNISEFEALTGVSSLFLNNTMAFNIISKRHEFPSIVSVLEQQGYKSAAIHFNSGLFYNRTVGYENLGIDHFYNDSELTMEYFDNNQTYSNDESSFKQILKVLTENNEPTFIHNVTIQNHGPYPFEISNNDYNVEGLYNTSKKSEAETYYKEIEHTDEQLKVFLDELEQFQEPTIVVFWGDHLPYFYANEDFGEDILDKYRTPLLIYSNFDTTENKDIGNISMNYIPNTLFDIYNLKQPAYFYMLDDVKNKTNVLQGLFVKADPTSLYAQYKSGVDVESETSQIFDDYKMIIYDIIVGENYSVDMGFFDIEG